MKNATDERFLDQLNSIEGNGEYVVTGSHPAILPGLKVAGLGKVSFPLLPAQAQALIQVARQAPFGKGSETVTDLSVRKTWEIDASQLSFENPHWEKFLKQVQQEIQLGLGLEETELSLSLYKLLVYEAGGFFLPHKDTEKEAGMFATLLIGLPSTHTGGELLVRFGGEERSIDFSTTTSEYELPYVAFYADCEHEVKPIRAGYRVSLVFNVGKQAGTDALPLPQFESQLAAMADLMREMKVAGNHFPRAILLGHEYTPANFSRTALKHHDKPRAEVLLAAAAQAGFVARLGLLTHNISGDWENESHGYDYWGDDDELDESPVMGEIFDQTTTIEYWSEDGPDVGTLILREEHILTDIEVGVGEPTEFETEGYTGNAGMTVDYWYHYGAMVIWPSDQLVGFLLERPVPTRLEWLDYYLKNGEESVLQSSSNIYSLMLSLIPTSEKKISQVDLKKSNFSGVARGLVRLQDVDLFQKMSDPVLIEHFSQIDLECWELLLQSFDLSLFVGIFEAVRKTGTHKKLLHLLRVLELIEKTLPSPRSDFFMEQIEQLPQFISSSVLWRQEEYDYLLPNNAVTRKELAKEIISLCLKFSKWKAEDPSWTERFLNALSNPFPREYVNELFLPILGSDFPVKSLLFLQLQEVALENLRQRAAEKPVAPTDWRQEVPTIQGFQGEWGRLLTPFLLSPSQGVLNFQAVLAERKELERFVRRFNLDINLETIRKGSPHTLRLTKTQAAYQRAIVAWKEDVDLLKNWEGSA